MHRACCGGTVRLQETHPLLVEKKPVSIENLPMQKLRCKSGKSRGGGTHGNFQSLYSANNTLLFSFPLLFRRKKLENRIFLEPVRSMARLIYNGNAAPLFIPHTSPKWAGPFRNADTHTQFTVRVLYLSLSLSLSFSQLQTRKRGLAGYCWSIYTWEGGKPIRKVWDILTSYRSVGLIHCWKSSGTEDWGGRRFETEIKYKLFFH